MAGVRSSGMTRGDVSVVTGRTRSTLPREGVARRIARPTRPTRRMHQVFERTCDAAPSTMAADCGQLRVTYRELEVRANRMAHVLRARGIGSGCRVAILLNRSVETYVTLLAVGKAGAAFVPIDPGSPPERVAYIAEDANVALLVTSAELAQAAAGLERPVLVVDACTTELALAPITRPVLNDEYDAAAYVIYTSGSTGRPKGVEVAQSSICNFLAVVPEVYDVRPGDRVYQGMTISFDFSIEEIWPTWAVGATLVAGPNDSRRLGAELADFLDEADVTVFYCVPTLLATIPRELPQVRSVLVGGEACPQALVQRWARPGRRMLNTYGPTETTVTATWCELLPDRPVTIGRPLPTYSVLLMDENGRLVADGEVGEICIGGPGVARGYVGRPELTAEKFIEHPMALSDGRLYRTGDLGRLTADGEIEYLGRADVEVKIRGHRVDLGEIESILLTDAEVAEAVAALVPVSDAPDAPRELAAYIVRNASYIARNLPYIGNMHSATFQEEYDADNETLTSRLHGRLRERLPSYMIPSFMDVVAWLPTMPSGKVDRKRLPLPTARRVVVADGPVVPPADGLEQQVRAVWAEAFGIAAESLSVEANFFTDLGGHSLLAARVVSLLRGREFGAAATVRQVYAHPTVRGLAASLAASADSPQLAASPRVAPLRHSGRRIAAAGSAQAVLLYLLVLLITLPASYVYTRNDDIISGVVTMLVGYLALRWVVPLVLARPLAAGIRPGRYRLWGLTYLRLWALDRIVELAPLPVVSGSPLMAPYLRLLGARIGRRTTIATSTLSLPRLLDIGDDAAVGYGAALRPWHVEDGWVLVAPITIGERAFVGSKAVLEPGATLGAGAALGEQSTLAQGERVPDGERWAGSPPHPVAELTPTVQALLTEPGQVPGWRVWHIGAALLGLAALEVVPIAVTVPGIALVWWALLTWGPLAGLAAALPAGPLYVLTVCTVVAAGKRLVCSHAPVGIHSARSGLALRKWMVDKLLEFSLTFTNSLYATLYTVPWLRLLGARVGSRAEVSTASHLDPELLVLGEESFVADMASVGAATFANGRMALVPTEIGRRAFVGNAAVVSAGTRMGDGSLVGVSTVPPRTGVPDGSSWLGSPAIHLPQRQHSGDFSEEETYRPPRAVVAHRLRIEFLRATLPGTVLGMGAFLYLQALTYLADSQALDVVAWVSPLLGMAVSTAVITFCVAVKRMIIGTYRPRVEPLWSRFVRHTEFVTGLYEAAAVSTGVGMLVGTPFLPIVLRWFGARIGRRTWIGTTYLTEFDLVNVGDDATVGIQVSLQTHLFEDRVMKMSTVTVGAGATLGTRAVVLYDSVVGDDVSLGALSLLMKGEHLITGTRWRGIPAQRITTFDAAKSVMPEVLDRIGRTRRVPVASSTRPPEQASVQ